MTDWGLTWDEYKELEYFCRQYDRKRREADALLTLRVSTPEPVRLKNGEGMFLPRGGGGKCDPVAAAAEKRERYLHDIAIIDAAAKLAGQDLAAWLLRAVTKKGGMNRELIRGCPCSQSAFYAMRRRFFFILKQLRDGNV
nr:MAG TPA: hypothetical protein [Caudoviricetes sp.]DAU71909.1 MAG TPA: hypothetical protein [Caudoviricetes sp.]